MADGDRISELPLALASTGVDEFLEIIQRNTETGQYENRRIAPSTLWSGGSGGNGLSAYQVAVQQGFTGTEQQWLASLQGQPGTPGVDGVDGAPGADGQDGKSAYQLAVEAGFVGDQAQWLNSLKSGKPEFQTTATHLQWRMEGDTQWVDLLELSVLAGGPVEGLLEITAAALTLDETHTNQYLVLNSGTPVTVTLPAQSSVGWTEAAMIRLEQGGMGKVSITAAPGVTLRRRAGFRAALVDQYAVVTLKRVAVDTWTLYGELEAGIDPDEPTAPQVLYGPVMYDNSFTSDTSGFTGDWALTEAWANTGVNSLGSSNAGAGSGVSTTTFTATLGEPAIISFAYRVDSAPDDRLTITLNGTQVVDAAGQEGAQTYIGTLPAGAVELVLSYTKTGGDPVGLDQAFIDDLSLEAIPETAVFSGDALVLHNGSYVVVG